MYVHQAPVQSCESLVWMPELCDGYGVDIYWAGGMYGGGWLTSSWMVATWTVVNATIATGSVCV